MNHEGPNIFKPRNNWNVISFNCNSYIKDVPEEKIRRAVRREYYFDPFCMTGSHEKEFVRARMIFIKLIKTYTNYSLSYIGMLINKDHATVIYALKSFSDEWDTNNSFREKFKAIDKRISKQFNN